MTNLRIPFILSSQCRPLAATKKRLSPGRGVWSLSSSQPEMDAYRQSPPCLRTFPVKGISKQYAVISKPLKPWKQNYWRLLTAYCLLVLCGSKETTPPVPGSGNVASLSQYKRYLSSGQRSSKNRPRMSFCWKFDIESATISTCTDQ
jgi:hypothetical protein